MEREDEEDLVHVLLPPSEGKAPGGSGGALSLGELCWPALTPLREQVLEALTSAAGRPDASAVLGLGPTQERALAANRHVRTSPTLPAGERYTGVLYDALGYPDLPPAARSWAAAHVSVCSGLWGLVGLADEVPEYKLAMQTRLPGLPGLAGLWRGVLPGIIETMEAPVVDLRSGAYQQAGSAAGVIRARVLASVEVDGVRQVRVISHHNKASKGRLVRELALSEARSLEDVLAAAAACRLEARLVGTTLELVDT